MIVFYVCHRMDGPFTIMQRCRNALTRRNVAKGQPRFLDLIAQLATRTGGKREVAVIKTSAYMSTLNQNDGCG